MCLVVSELGAVKDFRGRRLSACLTDTSLLYTEANNKSTENTCKYCFADKVWEPQRLLCVHILEAGNRI